MTDSHSRVLICGSRRWPWPDTITTLLDRAAARHGNDLVIIEGAGTGAASAAHHWCTHHDLPAWRHRCHPLTPAPGRRIRTRCWSEAERNQRILHDEGPRLVIAFHENLHLAHLAAPTTCAVAPSPSVSPSGSCPPPPRTKACGCTSATTPARSFPHSDPTRSSPPPLHPPSPAPTRLEPTFNRVPHRHRRPPDPDRPPALRRRTSRSARGCSPALTPFSFGLPGRTAHPHHKGRSPHP
ncbi:SLOG family protein [Streptomyces solisilvae]|uniref:SLOG family protein n=1 Tax=Streptomyces malaysiensis TaxID=92644 RepID=UPI00367686D6